LSPWLIKLNEMNKIEGWNYSFLTSALDGKESASFIPRSVSPGYPLDSRLGNAGTGLQDINTLKKGKAMHVTGR
jgi:hypothetical protein